MRSKRVERNKQEQALFKGISCEYVSSLIMITSIIIIHALSFFPLLFSDAWSVDSILYSSIIVVSLTQGKPNSFWKLLDEQCRWGQYTMVFFGKSKIHVGQYVFKSTYYNPFANQNESSIIYKHKNTYYLN